MKNIRVGFVLTGMLLILLSACSENAPNSKATSPEDIWLQFGHDVVTFCREEDVTNLVENISFNIEDVNSLYDQIRKSNPNIDVPEIGISDNIRKQLASKTTWVVKTFIKL